LQRTTGPPIVILPESSGSGISRLDKPLTIDCAVNTCRDAAQTLSRATAFAGQSPFQGRSPRRPGAFERSLIALSMGPRCQVPERRESVKLTALFREGLWSRNFTAAPRPSNACSCIPGLPASERRKHNRILIILSGKCRSKSKILGLLISRYVLRGGRSQFVGIAMFRVVTSLIEQDWRVLVLAGLLCLLASAVAINLFHRAQAATGRTRLVWLSLDAAVAGFGIWATHLIVILTYGQRADAGYDLGLALLSLLIAVLIGVGLMVSLLGLGRWTPALGGAIVGAGTAGMQYTGMLALQLPGRPTLGRRSP
jgi:hypothetical protein